MRVLLGFPGWGWKMYGLASFRSGSMWFVGFSKQLPKVGAGGTAPNSSFERTATQPLNSGVMHQRPAITLAFIQVLHNPVPLQPL